MLFRERTQGLVPRWPKNEDGAALIIVLVALVGLTALAAAGMMLTDTELKVSQNTEASTHAFYAADAGFQQYLGTQKTGTAGAAYTFSPGSANVVSEKLLDLEDGMVLYRITSQSTYSPPEGGLSNREISTLAIYSVLEIDIPSSFTSPNGLLKSGGAGTISGVDQATGSDPECPDSPEPAVAGVAVPPSGYNQSGGTLVPDGDPPVDDSDTGEQMLQESDIPWEAIVNGEIAPDYRIPPDMWPDFSLLPADEWPFIYADGDFTVTDLNNGRGTLVVTGNLQMNGDWVWDGAVLVGGYVSSNGFQTIDGATVSGLNILLGESVPSSDIGNGNKSFTYNSCNLLKAMRDGFGGLSEVPGAWSESM
jgi:hypothetical protein